jgi:hypothetical protein
LAPPCRSVALATFVAVCLAAGPVRAGITSTDPASTGFVLDMRFGAYFASSGSHTAWAGLGGLQLGAVHWFDRLNVGLLFLAGPEAGYMSGKLGVLAATGEAGVIFALGSPTAGVPRLTSATTISLTWAPKLFLDYSFKQFGRGEVASPLGFEAAFEFSGFKIPVWILQTLDGTTIVGTSLGAAF